MEALEEFIFWSRKLCYKKRKLWVVRFQYLNFKTLKEFCLTFNGDEPRFTWVRIEPAQPWPGRLSLYHDLKSNKQKKVQMQIDIDCWFRNMNTALNLKLGKIKPRHGWPLNTSHASWWRCSWQVSHSGKHDTSELGSGRLEPHKRNPWGKGYIYMTNH